MKTTQPSDVVRQVFAAYETGDRKLMEAALAEDFAFKRCDVYFGPSIRSAPVAHEGGDER